jgi:pullulanase/glycogen debranching enzyme
MTMHGRLRVGDDPGPGRRGNHAVRREFVIYGEGFGLNDPVSCSEKHDEAKGNDYTGTTTRGKEMEEMKEIFKKARELSKPFG